MLEHVTNISPSVLQAVDPWFWAYVNQIKLVKGSFTLEGHEFQRDMMQDYDEAPVKVVMKATQMTITESAVLEVLHGMIHRKYPLGVLYLFPTNDDVIDFSASRFQPLIRNNPATIGSYIKDTNRANLKEIGGGFLFFRSGRLHQAIQKSMKASTRLAGIPADHAVFDEWDLMDMKAEEWVDGRMQHSNVKTKFFLANPSIPDYGIDKKYQLTDQRQWFIKCRHCGTWTCLEHTFPDCLLTVNNHVIRACQKCEREIYPSDGQWVAAKPSLSRDAIGWQISHLNSTFVTPANILARFRNPNTDMGTFYRLTLGQAYIEATNRLSIEEVMALCGSDGIASSDHGACFMGVDQGKDLHVVIGKKHPRAYGQIVHLGIYKDWEELDPLVSNFNVIRAVVDALPETRNARSFAERHKGKIYLNYYNEHQKGSYAWNESEFIVQCNRTESLDASHKEINEEAIYLPKKCEITELFAEHLHNVAKKLEEDEQTGSKHYVYVKLGPDHFRHSYNYECIARQNSPDLLFPEV